VLAALLAVALAAEAAPAPPLEVLEAGKVDYDVATGRGIARGGVVLRRGAVLLRAETATYDTRTGDVDAAGAVLLTEPGRAVSATRMHAVLDGPYAARDVVAFLKGTPLDLSTCRTLDEARGRGLNRLTLHGGEVRGESGAPDFEIDHARLTLCDCGGGEPSWEIHAHHADVVPGNRAILTWPVIYVTPRLPFVSGTLDVPVLRRIVNQQVPVLVLPAMYLPLGERQTGLLIPELNFGSVNGISQPLFITLGRSWDATVTADYNWSGQTPRAVGPGGSLELRWAPVEGASGQLHFSLLHGSVEGWPAGIALPPGGERLALSGFHRQRLSDATFLSAEVGLIGDPLYLTDLYADALLRATEYRRSAVALTHRTDELLLEADAAYNLPLVHLDSGSVLRAPFGVFGTDLQTFHRLPSASLSLLPTSVAGPLRVAGTLSIARFAPLHGATGDEGANGIGPGERGWGAEGSPPDAGEGDGRWTGPGPGGPGERLAATRLLARLELSAPLRWRALSIEPWAAATAAGFAFEAGPDPQVDARAAGGLAFSTQLGRTFGSGAGRIRHEIEPKVEWRGGTGQAGPALPNYAYDEFDVALPARVVDAQGLVTQQRTLSATPGSFSQLRLTLRNRLIAPAGVFSNAFLELTLGQDLDAAAGRASETWAQGALRLPFMSLDARAGFRAFGASIPAGTPETFPASRLDAFTELGGGITLVDPRGDNVHATFISLGAGASPRVMAGLEPFFDPRPFNAPALAQGSVGLGTHLGGATIGYDALFYGRELASPACPGNPRKTVSTQPHVYQHQALLVWDSPCHCWKAGVSAILNECDDHPSFHFILDLSAIAGGAAAMAR
jgi:LPS-assembly protein